MLGSGNALCLQEEEVKKINEFLIRGNYPCLQSSLVRVYDKAEMKGTILFGCHYRRVTKRNSFTVKYLKPPLDSVCYGIVDNFISSGNYYLASIKTVKLPGIAREPFGY